MVLRSARALLQARDGFDGLGDFGTHVAEHWEVYQVRGQRKVITHASYCLGRLIGIHFSQIGLLTSFILQPSQY